MRTPILVAAALSVLAFSASANADTSFGSGSADPVADGPAPGATQVRVDAPADTTRTSETPLDKRTQLGLRIGYARATGGVETRGTTYQYVPATLPILLDFGRFVGSHVYLGGTVGVMGTFQECGSCRGRGATLGFNARYHFVRDGVVDPWLSLSTGFDVLGLSDRRNTWITDARVAWHGMLGAGLDVRASRALLLGPYVGIGPSYELAGSNVGSKGTTTVGVATLGLRGAFELL